MLNGRLDRLGDYLTEFQRHDAKAPNDIQGET
jgi:hypothetical protein